MRTHTRWLALVLVGACGTTASAQSPVMYGRQPYPQVPMYPQYPQPWPQQMPNYNASPRYVPAPTNYPSAYYQPQPRVVYVPANGAPWQGGPPAAMPATRPVSATDNASIDNARGDKGSVTIVDASRNKLLPAKLASRSTSTAAEVVTQPTEGCDSSDGVCFAPEVCHDDHANWLPKGQWNLQILGGYFGDIGDANYNWAQTSIRLGHVWNCECVPGAFEGLIDINGASTVDSSFGNHFFGGGLIARYNLVTLGSRVVPYVQGGIGFQYNDAYLDEVQQHLGSRMALTAQADVGLRLFLTKRLSLDLEGGYRFISGLSMSDRDEGINALGGMAGLTYFFPCLCRR
jgi:opacity protein-like surface antigen